MTATTTRPKSKPKTKAAAKRTEFGAKGEADLFVIRKSGPWAKEAESWLTKRGVAARDSDLYVILANGTKWIRWFEWRQRFARVEREFLVAGWLRNYDDRSGGWQWRKELAGVMLGIRIGAFGCTIYDAGLGDGPWRKLFPGFQSFMDKNLMDEIDPAAIEEAILKNFGARAKNKIEAEKSSKRSDVKAAEIEQFLDKRTKAKGKGRKSSTALATQVAPRPSASSAVKKKPGTKLVAPCGHDIPPAVIDVPSTAVSADTLSAKEFMELQKYEKAIDTGARAWVEMAEGLAQIFDRRLYRDRHGTFDAWLESKRLDRSVAYGLIKAIKIRWQLQTISRTLPAIELDRESQYRPFPADANTQDLAAVMRRVAKKVDPDPDGVRRPTAADIRKAVHEETTSPDDLKRESAKRQKRTSQASGATKLTHIVGEMPAEREKDEPLAAEISRSRLMGSDQNLASLCPPDDWMKILRSPDTPDGSSPILWNGKANPYALQLRGLSRIVEMMISQHLGQGEQMIGFRRDLASLLDSLRGGLAAERRQPMGRSAK